MRMLIVEDDEELLQFLKLGFQNENWAVDTSTDGNQSSYMARTNEYDIALIDLSVPSKNGMQVCKDIRKAQKPYPILILTANSDVTTKVEVLESGADDYVTKPFSFKELIARVKALTRRPSSYIFEELSVGDLVMDTKRQMVKRDGTAIYLTRKEYTLLEFLMRNSGTTLSRGMIMEHVWSIDSDPFSNTIEAHIMNLRKKLNTDARPNLIHNVPGRGYKIDAEQSTIKEMRAVYR